MEYKYNPKTWEADEYGKAGYHTSKEPEESNTWRYIKAEEIEVIGNVND